MSSIYLTLICKGKFKKNVILGFATGFVWFVGFGAKGYGMSQAGDKIAAVIIDFFLLGARSFTIFYCVPLTCG